MNMDVCMSDQEKVWRIVALISRHKQVRVRSSRGFSRTVSMRETNGEPAGTMTTNGSAKRIRIRVGGIQLEAELKGNRTADEVYRALPAEGPLNVWGEEFYFKVPGVKDHRETATTQVKVGDVAFWGAGQVLAIFFGRTPMSMGLDPVPADRVNVIGRVVGDAAVLRQVMTATSIRVEPLDPGPAS
jgi:hypothetical protein